MAMGASRMVEPADLIILRRVRYQTMSRSRPDLSESRGGVSVTLMYLQ